MPVSGPVLQTVPHPQNPHMLVRGNPAAPIAHRQWYEVAGASGAPECWVYTDRLSYAPGDTVQVHGIAHAPKIRLKLARDGTRRGPRLSRTVPAWWADTPQDASVAGCGWPVIATIRIPADWPSGAYILDARTDDGARAEHLVVVRAGAGGRQGRAVLITADRTWAAYNDWGGSNHYEGVSDPAANRFSPVVSAHRPFARGFVRLPGNAPRPVLVKPPLDGRHPGYPWMDWAFANGFSKKYASAGWASYERHFMRWAERAGLPVDVCTQADLHNGPAALEGYACAVIVGHDEYWSWDMRDAVEAYVAGGGRVARFAGNFLWQIRLEDGGARQACYKYEADADDPLAGTDRKSTAWDAPELGRPGWTTFGASGGFGVYAGFGGLAANGSGGFTLARPRHWAFAGTGLGYGDVLGGASRVFGYEVDGLPHRTVDGLPEPDALPGLPADLSILAQAPARLREDAMGADPSTLFVGDADAKFAARAVHGRSDAAALDAVDRGSGVIVSFTHGRGEVFNAGTCEWVNGLRLRDHGIETVTRNVLTRFLR